MTPEERFKENERLIPYVLRKVPKTLRKGYWEDLYQEGAKTLWICCLCYKPERGVRFGSYAYPCIRLAAYNYIYLRLTYIRPKWVLKGNWDEWWRLRRQVLDGEPAEALLLRLPEPNTEEHAWCDRAASAVLAAPGENGEIARMNWMEDLTLETIARLRGVSKQAIGQRVLRIASWGREWIESEELEDLV